MSQRHLITIAELAPICGLTIRSLRSAIARKQLHVVRLKTGSVRVHLAEVRRFMGLPNYAPLNHPDGGMMDVLEPLAYSIEG